MANQFADNKTIAVGKEETTPGTMETLTSADFDARIRDPQVTPIIEIDDEASRWARGDHGEDASIMGAQSGTIAFGIKMLWGGAVTTEPNWWKWAKGAGSKVITYAGTGLGLQPRMENDEKTMTIWVYAIQRGATPAGLCFQFAGCKGTQTFGADGVGKPWMAMYTFTGKLVDVVDIANGSVPVPQDLDTTCSDKMLNNTMLINDVTQRISNFTLDTGNEIQPIIDQSESTGYSHYVIGSRAPRFATNPLMKEVAEDDVWGKLTSGLTGCLDTYAMGVGDTGLDNKFMLIIPKGQLLSAAVATRERSVNWDQNYKLLPNGVTGAIADPSLAEEVTWELLQGARS